MRLYLAGIMFGALALLLALLLGLATRMPESRAASFSASGPPQWGPDIQVNPVTTSTTDIQRSFALALDPTNPNQVIAGYDSWDPPQSYSGYSFSTDAGRTWTGGRFYGPWISDTIPFGQADVAIDRTGTIYYTCLATGNSQGDSAFVVLTSTTGTSWSAPNPIVVSPYSRYYDQGRLALDPRTSGPFAGRLYLLLRYAENGRENQALRLRYSSDQGRTWSDDVDVADPAYQFSDGLGLVAAADGTLYATYATDLYNDPLLYLHRSSDGGATWSAGSLISGAPISKIGVLDFEGFELLLLGDIQRGFRIANNPAIAVARDDPRILYAAWNDGRWEGQFSYFRNLGRYGDIAFSRSTDSGTTWSAPVRVNDDPPDNKRDQFTPAIAVGADGRIGLTWYDRRDAAAPYLYYAYYSESTDGGVTWSANQRISDAPGDPMARTFFEGNGDLSERTALLLGPDYVLPSWVDTRAGAAQDFYTDHGTVGGPNPDPTASPLPSVTPAPLATSTLPPCVLRFSDVPPDAYFAGPVAWLACRGVISGYGDGTFRPYNMTTRGQLAKIVVLGFGWPLLTPAAPTFADVPPGAPFYSFVETAVAHGTVSGYDCGGVGEPCPGRYFRPAANVTRGQLAKIITGAAGWPPLAPPAPRFADVPAGSPFYGYVEQAAAHGVLSGYSCGGVGEPCPGAYFRAAAPSTRGQLSKILYNVLAAP